MTSQRMDDEVLAFYREVLHPGFRKALSYNLTAVFRSIFIKNAREQLNTIISIFGKTGSGKSVISWILGEWNCDAYGREMSADYVFFDDYNLLKALENSEPGDICIKDEQVETYGEGSIQVASMLKNIEMTVREGEVSLIYVGPELRLHCHHYIIRPALKMWRIRPRDYRVMSWVFDGLKKNVEGNYPIGFLMTGLPKGTRIDESKRRHRDKIIWSEEYLKYKKKKHAFIEQAKRGEVSSGSDMLVNDIAELFIDTYEDLEGIETKRELKAILISDDRYRRNLTTGQLDTVAELVRIKCKLYDKPLGFLKKRKR